MRNQSGAAIGSVASAPDWWILTPSAAFPGVGVGTCVRQQVPVGRTGRLEGPDPGSEAHDMVMTLFGGMSKGESSRRGPA
jgi:hypothetical protein